MKLNKATALEILNAGLATGADYSEIYYQDATSHRYARRYRKVYSVGSGRTCGYGIRLIKGTKVVYGYTSDGSKKSLLKLATDLSYGFEGERVLTVTDLKYKKVKVMNPIRIQHNEWDTAKKIAYLKTGEDAAFDVSDKIQDVITSLNESDEYVEIYNSKGFEFSDNRIRTRVSAMAIASDGQQFTQNFEGPGLSKGLELLEEIDFPAMAKKVAETSLELLTAEDGPSGEMPVVISNAFGGVLFHESCGHPLEGSAICRQTSPFAGKLGEKIASDVVTAIDDGTIPNGWGSESVDDEGELPTKNYLITNGVLTNYMLDNYTARRIGETMTPSGSCRRENYRYVPTTRMTNTYIDQGKSTPEEIIASVKNGIYCKGFTGGQVDPSTCQFIFTSDCAYLIKDGKLDHLIKPVSLIGYGYEILPRITMVGNDLERAPGVCGASSGSCYVEVGQPTLLISSILVGGAGGN